LAVTEKRLHELKLHWQAGASVCVIAAAAGYPGPPTKGMPITLPEVHTQETQIFHAGTAIQNEQLVTNGGRVFGISAQGADIAEAREQAYSLLEKVRFQGKHFRRDIAVKALN
jgi:phosphoribosylamine--glycine ligase